MQFGQFSLRHLFLLTLCAMVTVWFGLETGKALMVTGMHTTVHADLPAHMYTTFIAGVFAVCLGAFAGGLIGRFVPGAIVGFLSYSPLFLMFLHDWLLH